MSSIYITKAIRSLSMFFGTSGQFVKITGGIRDPSITNPSYRMVVYFHSFTNVDGWPLCFHEIKKKRKFGQSDEHSKILEKDRLLTLLRKNRIVNEREG
jgi:hypothetical protein